MYRCQRTTNDLLDQTCSPQVSTTPGVHRATLVSKTGGEGLWRSLSRRFAGGSIQMGHALYGHIIEILHDRMLGGHPCAYKICSMHFAALMGHQATLNGSSTLNITFLVSYSQIKSPAMLLPSPLFMETGRPHECSI